MRGNATWSSQAILRILQNEKYCGDVLLQKTFTEGVLTGTQKKNTGQLPQYYIENHHEGIVTKQMFREVQAEIAKRQSKDPANIRKREKDDTTVSMHYQGGWFAVNVAAAINESSGIFTAAKRWFGGVQTGQPMVRNSANTHHLSRKKNCMKQF